MTLDEAKAYLRIEGDGEDAALSAMVAVAAATAEAFLGGPLVRREIVETVAGDGSWQRLSQAPVHAITAVGLAGDGGDSDALLSDRYAIDIDAAGEGWVRVRGGRVRVTYEAGIAATIADVPAAIAHGVIRLAAHLHDARDTGQAPPTAVTALWRPWRRMRIGDGAR